MFCFGCLVQWRKTAKRGSGMEHTHACPTCRAASDFVVPSFCWVTGDEKAGVIKEYQKRCSEIKCVHFTNGAGCLFGNACFYKHVLEDGTIVDKDSQRAAFGEATGILGARGARVRAREAQRRRVGVSRDILADMAAHIDTGSSGNRSNRSALAASLRNVAEQGFDDGNIEDVVAALLEHWSS